MKQLLITPLTKRATIKLLAARIMQALQAALQKLDRGKLLLTTVQQVAVFKMQSQAIPAIQAPQTMQKLTSKKQALHNLTMLKPLVIVAIPSQALGKIYLSRLIMAYYQLVKKAKAIQ